MEQQPDNTYRRVMTACVSSILDETGFDSTDKDALGSLTEMLTCFLVRAGELTSGYCDIAGRTEPIGADVILAFIDMGFNFPVIANFVKTGKHNVLPALVAQQPQKQLNMLTAGSKQPLPSHIPQHLPQFPDPHAYVRTPTHKQPIIDYESVREKSAIQKREIEKSVTRYLARTGPSRSLYDNDDSNILSLIAVKPPPPPCLSALMPLSQIFDNLDLDLDDRAQMMAQAKEQKKQDNENGEENTEETLNDSVKSEDNAGSNIDNPYLVAVNLSKQDDLDNS